MDESIVLRREFDRKTRKTQVIAQACIAIKERDTASRNTVRRCAMTLKRTDYDEVIKEYGIKKSLVKMLDLKLV